MKKIKVAVIGYGNVGQYTVETVNAAEDMELVGVVRRSGTSTDLALSNTTVVDTIDKLGKVDVALLCTPTRQVETQAKAILAQGISTVDSFDIHGGIVALRKELSAVAKANNVVAVVSAGWDPGSDSIVRGLMQAMAPQGITYTNFGPGMSMGHTVAAKSTDGVLDALSMTIPQGSGVHNRLVYVTLEQGADFATVTNLIKSDPYFAKDNTHVVEVPSINELQDCGHGVHMSRKGMSGATPNQRFSFDMTINNPALTAQVMVAAARAAMKQAPGAYTMVEIPVIDLLPGEREDWINKLV